jgi:Transposase DNA-binding/Transposase DDE domain
MELIGHSPDYKGKLGDARLENRARLIAQSLIGSKTSSIHATTQSESEQRGFYRFLANEKVTEQALVEELTTRCGKNVQDRDVLLIQDSSSMGFSHHSQHIKTNSGLGLVGNKIGLGFITHTSLVLDANNESILGFSDIQLWHRTEDKSNNTTRRYKQQAIEDKESYKWIKAGYQAKECLATARSITIIQDREGDIYEQFCLIPDAKTQLIIRNRDNRKLADGSKLYECLEKAPVLGTYTIAVYGDVRKEKVSRTATVEIKCRQVAIEKPASAKSKGIPNSLFLYAVEARENNGPKKDAICWRILTTIKVETYEEAIAIIEKYKQRWYIEQLFRLLKKQGYQIEDSQLETGWAIRKLFVLVLNAALRVMQLYLAYGKEESQATEEVFSEEEIQCLHAIEQNHIAKTEKTTNPFPAEKLSWASWIIARLGGWKGNNKQRRAGPIILKRGLDEFQTMYQGWKLARGFT